MHKELEAFFERHKSGTGEAKRAAHDQLRPIMLAAAGIEQHLAELEFALHDAELSPHDHAWDAKTAVVHTAIRATRERANAFRAAGRELALSIAKLERNLDRDFVEGLAGMRAREQLSTTGGGT